MESNVDQKRLKQTKFPPEFNQKVDMQKVNVEVIKKWIAGKISQILESEDDVVIELCFNLLEGSRFPSIKSLQIQLTGFLEKDTASFCKELWTLCLSAQSSPQGVPTELLEAKKLELMQEKIEGEKAAEAARKRREEERARERDVDKIRQRERGDRGGNRGDWVDRGRGRGRGGHNGRDFDRRPPRDSRSPPPYRRRGSDDFRGPSRRSDVDSYMPSGGGGRTTNYGRRRRSPSDRSRSFSRTPPRRNRRSKSRSTSRPPREARDDRKSRSRERSPDGARRGNGRPAGRGDHRARRSPIDTSHSRSPRPTRRRRSPTSPSRSPSPPRRAPKRYRRSTSRSRSPLRHSRSPSPRRPRESNGRRRRRSPSYEDHRYSRADVRKDRSPQHRPERSRSADRHRPAKRRHRSIERYNSQAKRRRNSSSDRSKVENREGNTSGGKDEIVADTD